MLECISEFGAVLAERSRTRHELGWARGKQRDLANFLWVAYFNELFQAADNMNRMLLAEGVTAGSGLFLQSIPSVTHFRFSPQVMRTQVKALL